MNEELLIKTTEELRAMSDKDLLEHEQQVKEALERVKTRILNTADTDNPQ